VYFEAKGREPELEQMSAISFLVDNYQYRISKSKSLSDFFTKDGWAIIVFKIDKDMQNRLKSSSKIGVFVQFSYDAPTFYGIREMDFATAVQKFKGFLLSCN